MHPFPQTGVCPAGSHPMYHIPTNWYVSSRVTSHVSYSHELACVQQGHRHPPTIGNNGYHCFSISTFTLLCRCISADPSDLLLLGSRHLLFLSSIEAPVLSWLFQATPRNNWKNLLASWSFHICPLCALFLQDFQKRVEMIYIDSYIYTQSPLWCYLSMWLSHTVLQLPVNDALQ